MGPFSSFSQLETSLSVSGGGLGGDISSEPFLPLALFSFFTESWGPGRVILKMLVFGSGKGGTGGRNDGCSESSESFRRWALLGRLLSFEKRFKDDFDLRSSPEADEVLYATPRDDLLSSPDLRLPSEDGYKVNDDFDANPNDRENDDFESDVVGYGKLWERDYIRIRQRGEGRQTR